MGNLIGDGVMYRYAVITVQLSVSLTNCGLAVSGCSCQSSRNISPPAAGRSPLCSPYRWGSALGQVILVLILIYCLKSAFFDISVGQ